MDLVQEIDVTTTQLIEARQRLARTHERICETAINGTLHIEENLIDNSIWNNYGIPLINARMFSDAEHVYRDMLKTIKIVEKSKGKLHKGLALYNMGLSQFRQRNFEEGIPNILASYEEDIRRIGGEEASKKLASQFNQHLYGLTANVINVDYLNGLRKTCVNMTTTSFAMLQKLSESEFLLLSKIVLSKRNVEFRGDMFTRVILFDNLRNLCWLLEAFLRRKTGSEQGLKYIFNSVFSGDSWLTVYNKYEADRTHFTAASVKEAVNRFELNLKFIQGTLSSNAQEDLTARAFLSTVLVRHFTSHYFDAYEELGKDEALYLQTFDRGMFAVLYTLNAVT